MLRIIKSIPKYRLLIYMQQNIVAEEMEIVIQSQFQRTGTQSSKEAIFGPNFSVEDMSNPLQFLPKYQQNVIQQKAFIQDCYICCGSCCLFAAYPFALLGCKCCCVTELSTSTAGIIEQFGKFKRLINPGLNFINPCSEQIRYVDMKINILTPGQNACITKDNVKVTVSSSIAYRITNPLKAYYILGGQLNHALSESTYSSIRNVIGQSTLDQVLINREKIVTKTLTEMRKSIPQGVSVENFFIENIMIPPETMRDLSAASRQKRVGQATIINSKADVQSASLLKQAADLLDTKAAMQIRYLQMVTEIGKKGAKLIMPIGVNNSGSMK